MSYGNRDLDRAVAIANALTVRPDKRCFCRLTSASALQEITPRVAQALRLAKEAAPHWQRHVLLLRKRSLAQSLGAQGTGRLNQNAGQEALAAIPSGLRTEIEALQEELRRHPPTEGERTFLEAAAFGSYSTQSGGDL